MNKLTNKQIFISALLFCAVLFSFSTFVNLKEKRERELNYQKLLARKEADRRAAEDLAQKKDYLMGKFEPSTREDFMVVPDSYNASGYKMYLRRETLQAFSLMQSSAERAGINLKIASATRNFNYQRNIWNNKWNGVTLVEGKKLNKAITDELLRFKKILEYSSVPGTSRHHWGTDIDINDSNPEYFETKVGKKVYAWLTVNAPSFGFCQPYNAKGKNRPYGYEEEKWHWSYLPLAKNFTAEYKSLITEKDIQGFLGDEYVLGQNLINKYVLGINAECIL